MTILHAFQSSLKHLVFSAFCALIATPALAAKVTDYMLDNGMQVVVLEDHRAPVVVHMVWYRVGAADETPGTSGIAHFLEHLMFKGTDTMDAGELSATVARNGGSDNAFTSWDFTAYFQRVGADRLPLLMQMEADRMRNLQMTDADVATERDVVLEERNQRIDSDPGERFSEQRRAALFLNHPYGRPIIGWRHEIEALNRDDAFEFYGRYYAPNNAILIVAGDVDPSEVLALAQTHYGPIAPSTTIPERIRAAEPPQIAERRMAFADANISQPYVIRTYLAPERDPGDQGTAAALSTLAALLGGSSTTSVLGRALQFDTQTAVYTGAGYDGTSMDDATFQLVVVPKPGVSLGAAEAALDAALAAFLETGVDADQFARLKMQQRAALVYAEDNIVTMARGYGAALASGLTLEDVKDWPAALDRVTAEDVMAAAKLVLNRDQSVTGWVAPDAEGLKP